MAARLCFEKHIRSETRKEVKKLAAAYGITDDGGLKFLHIFAAADTTERNALDIVNKDGMSILDKFNQVKSHPLNSVIRDARSQKMMALKALNLDLEPLNDRPGRPGGS